MPLIKVCYLPKFHKSLKGFQGLKLLPRKTSPNRLERLLNPVKPVNPVNVVRVVNPVIPVIVVPLVKTKIGT